MESEELKSKLESILVRHVGRSAAITAGELAELTGEPERRVRLAIRELIAKGLPVAAATEFPAGYFIVNSRQEVDAYAVSIKNRLIEDALRRRDFRKSAALYLTPARQERLI